jgi:hypothetical protein
MKTSTKALFAAAAMGGLLAGSTSLMAKAVKTDAGQSVVTYGDKGSCSGKDGCKGHSSCKAATKPADPAPAPAPAPAK